MSDSATLTPGTAAHGELDHDHEPIQLTRQQVYLTPGKLDLLQRFAIALCGAGAIMTLINCVAVGLQQTMFSYLFAFYFVLTVSLGGLFWTQIHHLTAAGWSTGIRRTYENFIRVLLVMGLLFIPIWLCLTQLYEWAAIQSAGETANNPNLRGGKGFYLSWPFFTVRVLLYFGVWVFFGYKFLTMSQQQDQSGDPELSRKMAGLSAPATLLLGVTATFAGFDLVMSLDYAWFSTMFGVYTWARLHPLVAGHRHADGATAAGGRAPARGHYPRTHARPGQAAVRLHRLLDLHCLLAILPVLVWQHARGNPLVFASARDRTER
jgi:hypothetical protein